MDMLTLRKLIPPCSVAGLVPALTVAMAEFESNTRSRQAASTQVAYQTVQLTVLSRTGSLSW
ncbi:hypothetical protein FQZ97_580220 [compost metagenome]